MPDEPQAPPPTRCAGHLPRKRWRMSLRRRAGLCGMDRTQAGERPETDRCGPDRASGRRAGVRPAGLEQVAACRRFYPALRAHGKHGERRRLPVSGGPVDRDDEGPAPGCDAPLVERALAIVRPHKGAQHQDLRPDERPDQAEMRRKTGGRTEWRHGAEDTPGAEGVGWIYFWGRGCSRFGVGRWGRKSISAALRRAAENTLFLFAAELHDQVAPNKQND